MNLTITYASTFRLSFRWRPAFFCLLFCLLGSIPLQASNLFNVNENLPDSIQQRLDALAEPRAKIELLLSLVEEKCFIEPSLAYGAAKAAEVTSVDIGHEFYRAQSLYWQAWLYIRSNPYEGLLEQCFANLRISLGIFDRLGENEWWIKASDQLAALYFYQGDYQRADSVIDEVITAFPAGGQLDAEEPHLRALLYQTKASTLYHLDDSTYRMEGKQWMEQSLALFERAKDQAGIAKATLGLTAWTDAVVDDSLYQKAIGIYEQLGYRQDLKEALLDYGNFLLRQYSRDPSDDNFKRCLTILEAAVEIQDVENCDAYSRIGKLYHFKAYFAGRNGEETAGILDSAFLAYYNAVTAAGVEGDGDCLLGVAKEIAKVCPSIEGSCQTALRHISVTYDSLFHVQKEYVVQAENQIQDFRIGEQAAQNQLQVNRRNRWIWLLAVLLLVSATVFLWYRNRDLRRAVEAEQTAYRMQINPHFFSNALESIEGLVNTLKTKEASRYLVQFARLARTVMESSEEKWIPLADELVTIKDYLSLENLRLENRLEFDIEMEEELDVNRICIPPMLLQPVLENAVKHGIRPNSGGRIVVKFSTEENKRLVCLIEDDGIGINRSKSLREKNVQFRPSKGISITNKRIAAVKGRMEITDLSDLSPQQSGTVVSIVLPLHLNDQNSR